MWYGRNPEITMLFVRLAPDFDRELEHWSLPPENQIPISDCCHIQRICEIAKSLGSFPQNDQGLHSLSPLSGSHTNNNLATLQAYPTAVHPSMHLTLAKVHKEASCCPLHTQLQQSFQFPYSESAIKVTVSHLNSTLKTSRWWVCGP